LTGVKTKSVELGPADGGRDFFVNTGIESGRFIVAEGGQIRRGDIVGYSGTSRLPSSGEVGVIVSYGETDLYCSDFTP
jgi:hypothetical protein